MTVGDVQADTDNGPGPNLRRRDLGRQLRKLRVEAKLSAAHVGKFAGLTETSVRRIESGSQTILPRNVRLLCQCYGADAPLVDHLMRQAEESNERGWWAMYSDTVPDWFEKIIGLESDADRLWYYSPMVVDGLLQTADYAQALFEIYQVSQEQNALSRSIELRKARQDRVNRETNPAHLRVVLDEAAVRRTIGGRSVMRDQLKHLCEVAAQPNIVIQIVPFSAGGHVGLECPFRLLRFPDGFDDMDAVYLENQRGAIWQERPADIKHYTQLFEQISQAALSPADTVDFINSVTSSL